MILVAVAILIAVAIPIVTTFLGARWIRSQKEERRKKMECLAWNAVKTAMNLVAEEDTERQEFTLRLYRIYALKSGPAILKRWLVSHRAPAAMRLQPTRFALCHLSTVGVSGDRTPPW